MVNTINPTIAETLSWKKAFIQSAKEFEPTDLKVIEGAIPPNLTGSFYTIGPGLLERNGETIAHWFDGDGGILKVNFTGETATAMYRYVQTEAYQQESAEGKFSFGSYGRLPSGSFWQKLTVPIKNRANSGIIALENRLLALWNAGSPYVVNPNNLATQGIDPNFGTEKAELPYSSSPKIDPETGRIYNFGIEYGTKAQLKLYCSDRTGRIIQQADIPLEGFPYIHNFILAGRYLVFFIPPLRLKLLPFLSKQKSFADALSWKPELGTEILIIDHHTFEVVSEGITAPWFSWNYSNGYVDQVGNIVIQAVCYPDFGINEFLKYVPSNHLASSSKGKLREITINPQTGQVINNQSPLNNFCEYPVVAEQDVGKPWRFTYLSVYSHNNNVAQDLPDTIARFDRQTGELTTANLGKNYYPVLMVHVNNAAEDWLLVQVFNGNSGKSEVWVFDTDQLDSKPVCKLALPAPIPFGFAGVWQDN
ncbi:carotenoid oxygenase [Chondrocystis sp. NIES-4102]|nr:carotenoid oxygenase [Chondrocystis sp. NIES-4102]